VKKAFFKAALLLIKMVVDDLPKPVNFDSVKNIKRSVLIFFKS